MREIVAKLAGGAGAAALTLLAVGATFAASKSDYHLWTSPWLMGTYLLGALSAILFVASVLMPSDDDATTGTQGGPGGAIGGAGRDQHFYAPVNVYSHPAPEADASPVIDALKIQVGAAFFRTLQLLPTLSYRLVELQAVRVVNNHPLRSATLEFSLLGTTDDGTTYTTRAIPEGHSDAAWLRNVSVGHHLEPMRVDPQSVLPLEKLCFAISKDAVVRLENADHSIPTSRLRLRVDELITKTHLITTVFDRDKEAAPVVKSTTTSLVTGDAVSSSQPHGQVPPMRTSSKLANDLSDESLRGFQRRGLDVLNSINGFNPSLDLVARAEFATKQWAEDVGAALSAARQHEVALHFAQPIRRGTPRSASITAGEISTFVGERVQRLGLLMNQRVVDHDPEAEPSIDDRVQVRYTRVQHPNLEIDFAFPDEPTDRVELEEGQARNVRWVVRVTSKLPLDAPRAHFTILLPDNLITTIGAARGTPAFHLDHTDERMVSDSKGSLRLRAWVGPIAGRTNVTELDFDILLGYAREIPVRVQVTSDEIGNVSYYGCVTPVMVETSLSIEEQRDEARTLRKAGDALVKAETRHVSDRDPRSALARNVDEVNEWLKRLSRLLHLYYGMDARRVREPLSDAATSWEVLEAVKESFPPLAGFSREIGA